MKNTHKGAEKHENSNPAGFLPDNVGDTAGRRILLQA
jgi:hypothetical protein